MIKRIYKILFLVISISFFISATEMDLGNMQNTFFDEYDTYLKADNVSIDYTTFSSEDQDIHFVTPPFAHWIINHVDVVLNKAHLWYGNNNTTKLFLHYSVWRI